MAANKKKGPLNYPLTPTLLTELNAFENCLFPEGAFNPEGNCKCRIKENVREINLDKEFDKIRNTVNKMRFYKEAEKILPGKNYWEKYLN